MANFDGIPASETREKILSWLEFCYLVATNQLSEMTKLRDTNMATYFSLSGDACFSRNIPNCVGDLFDIYGEHRKAKQSISDIALGAMLHTIQDSFSKSHVQRDTSGKIIQFYSYQNQDEEMHAKEDAMQLWGTSKNPVIRRNP